MPALATGSPPTVDATGVTFRFPDPDNALFGVSLVQEVALPRSGHELERLPEGGGWLLRFARPPVDRLEYLFELFGTDGRTELTCDPSNPLRSPGPFGDKSVVEFPGYEPPAWLAASEPAGAVREIEIPTPSLGAPVRALLWEPQGIEEGDRLPLLVANDGIEYAHLSALTTMLEALTFAGELPPMRAALLHPVRRDEDYSASPAYAASMAQEVLPFLGEIAPAPPGRRWRVGMGASLGALAMLHAHRVQPACFGGLFLQSGSFFHHRYDRKELPFDYFQRIRHFMDRVHADREWGQPIPVTMTCGVVEENLANNRAAGLALRSQGYALEFKRLRDAHNWIAWRDGFAPALVPLLRGLWS